MNKLIFCPDGNINQCCNWYVKNHKEHTHFLGCTDGYNMDIEFIKRNEGLNYIYITAIPTFLGEHLWFDETTQKFNIFIWRNNTLTNIHDLTDKWIKEAHNIERMYLGGAFD